MESKTGPRKSGKKARHCRPVALLLLLKAKRERVQAGEHQGQERGGQTKEKRDNKSITLYLRY